MIWLSLSPSPVGLHVFGSDRRKLELKTSLIYMSISPTEIKGFMYFLIF
jgi:hypothetical protein